MKNFISKNLLLYVVLLTLTACGSEEFVSTSPTSSDRNPSEPTASEPIQDSASLLIGKSNYDTSCATCHGGSGENSLSPINTDTCLVADCSNVDSLAIYIDTNMPLGDAHSCSLDEENSCALTTAAYIINGFSTETIGEVPEESENIPPAETVQTPLARLTNDEFVNSVRTILNLPGDSPQINAAKISLGSESIVKGLASDASTQTPTQLTVAGYSTMALAASDDFLADINSKDELKALLDCPSGGTLRSCVEWYSNTLISKAYRRPANEDDAANITDLYESIIGFNGEYNNGLYNLTAHRNTLQAILQYIILSPEFSLVIENGKASDSSKKQLADHEIATRLALFLGGSLPDDSLLTDASAGLLADPQIRLQHADRLMNNENGVTQFSTLISKWLGIDASLADSADINAASTFITNWFVNEGIFSDLYQSQVTVEHIDGTETSEPLGVLGLQAFVASHTSFPTPSFITRGVFVVERLLCEALPEDLPDGALDAGALTPQEVFEVHDKQACATCHKVFDNYGAAFQQFDGETSLFNPAAQELGNSFDLYNIGDVTGTIATLGDLGHSMASSERASSCMTKLWYRHSKRRNIDEEGKDEQALQTLVNEWAESGDKSMKNLLRTIIASDSFITLTL